MSSGLFELVSREHLSDVLETLYKHTHLPVRLQNPEGEALLSFGDAPACCLRLSESIFSPGECAALHLRAGEQARRLGEAYIFTCHAGLNQIAFPLIERGSLQASVLIGPFLMDKPDSTLLSDVVARRALSPAAALELYDELGALAVIPPDRVTVLSRLIGFLLAPLLPEGRAELMHSRERLSQQSRINETVQIYKTQNVPASQSFFFEKETALLDKVRAGGVREAKALLNELLGYVLFCEGGRIDLIRLRAIELTTLLSRVAVEGGASSESAFALSGQFLSQIGSQQDFEGVSRLLGQVVETFMDLMFSGRDKGNPRIRQALRYISLNYARPLTIADVARELDLSPNYFATLFRQTVGESFRAYLARVRIEESKRLLLSTHDSLTDIALAMGFTDQSYYCRMFRRIVGMTPGKFRS